MRGAGWRNARSAGTGAGKHFVPLFMAAFTRAGGSIVGRKLFDRLNLVNGNPTTVEIAQRTLSAICRAIGRMQVQDSEELHLIPLIADVKVKPPKDGYDASNTMRYLPVEERAPAPVAPAPSPAPATYARAAVPAAAATRPAAATVAPWKRAG